MRKARGRLASALFSALLVVGIPKAIAAPRFDDVSAKSGVQEKPPRTWGSAPGDYDRDGDVDLFVGHHWFRPSLFRNQGGGTFGRVVEDSLYPRQIDRHGCGWGEANGDGRPDLYCTQGADRGTSQGSNQLLIQTDHGFVNRATSLGVHNPLGRGRTVNWLDFDSDGDLDIFVGNKLREGHPNVLFKNQDSGFRRAHVGLGDQLVTQSSSWSDWDVDGDPDLLVLQAGGKPLRAYKNLGSHFRRRSIPGLVGNWTAGSWGDYDGDGLPDLHLVRNHRAKVLHNTGRRFRTVATQDLTSGRMSSWLDVDNDRDLDLVVIQGRRGMTNRRDLLILNRGKRGFRKVKGRSFRGTRLGDGEAVSVADFDRDGRLDMFVTNGRYCGPSSPYPPCAQTALLRNRSKAGRSVLLLLRGGRHNPWGLGSHVVVERRYWSYSREITDGFNYRAQSDVSLVHVGLGGAWRARVRVEWPTGAADCIWVRHGRIRKLHKGSHPCE